ncbi:polysaccharide lyase [Kitasatospora sp. NPDC056731]|uniref:polysaccharide lyase n=1 Tax=Kitasatospora sp. NPDC056731 TaxID=3155422 RepID=UPI00341E9494
MKSTRRVFGSVLAAAALAACAPSTSPAAASGIGGIPFGGVFFSTFYGGHDTSWGPASTQRAYFADFSLSSGVQH